MGKNAWIDFVAQYRLKNPGMKYSLLLKEAAKSPDWQRYKKSNKNKPVARKAVKILGDEVYGSEESEPLVRRPQSRKGHYVDEGSIKQENARLKKQMKEMMGMMMKLHYGDETEEDEE
jgi:hypothetical protein